MTYFPQDPEPFDRSQALNAWLSTMHQAADRALKEIAESADELHDAAALGRFLSAWHRLEDEGDVVLDYNNRHLQQAYIDFLLSRQPNPSPWISLGDRKEFYAAVVNFVRGFRRHLGGIERLARTAG
jgi:hypothetical protein